MAKLIWRVRLIAELEPGIVSEAEVARIERDDFAVAETIGLTLNEGKRLLAAAQAEIVRAQVAAMGERFRWCEDCGAKLVSKGYYPATFRSVFGDVAVRVRRLCACGCRTGKQSWHISRRSSRHFLHSPRSQIYCPNSCQSAAQPTRALCGTAPCASGRGWRNSRQPMRRR